MPNSDLRRQSWKTPRYKTRAFHNKTHHMQHEQQSWGEEGRDTPVVKPRGFNRSAPLFCKVQTMHNESMNASMSPGVQRILSAYLELTKHNSNKPTYLKTTHDQNQNNNQNQNNHNSSNSDDNENGNTISNGNSNSSRNNKLRGDWGGGLKNRSRARLSTTLITQMTHLSFFFGGGGGWLLKQTETDFKLKPVWGAT